jgi:ABC-type sugar transport system ATPase subunit
LSITVADAHKSFVVRRSEPAAALAGVDLEVVDGELLAVLGPSGSGKSTLLRCIAGLEELDAGTIEVDGKDVTTQSPRDRNVAMVFQDYALYPHLDVATNIAFPLLARKLAKDDVESKVKRAAERLGLGALLKRRPGELSGGERRRVSLARAVVREPSAFLMDEPLSNLDAALKRRVLDTIRELQSDLGTTTLYVTHDQTEAMSLGHRLAVLRAGKVEQVGRPLELYDRPANTFVATFIGRTPMNLWAPGLLPGAGSDGLSGIRPEHLKLTTQPGGRLNGIVKAVEQLGVEVVIEVTAGEQLILIEAPRAEAPAAGDHVGIDFADRSVHRFSADGTSLL